MKKCKPAKSHRLILTVMIAITSLFFITGCTATDENSIVKIGERMFMTQIQDIYLNANDFLGRTIKLEGIFASIFWDGEHYFYVIRNAFDSCCGGGSAVGFEVMWPVGRPGLIPQNDSWVEASGMLKLFEGDPLRGLYLELTSLNVLDTRGAETVWR